MGNLCCHGSKSQDAYTPPPHTRSGQNAPGSLQSKDNADTEDTEPVLNRFCSIKLSPAHAWLKELGLSCYAQAFVAAGYDEWQLLATLDPHDLEMIELHGNLSILPGHRKKLLLASRQMGQQQQQSRGSSSNRRGRGRRKAGLSHSHSLDVSQLRSHAHMNRVTPLHSVVSDRTASGTSTPLKLSQQGSRELLEPFPPRAHSQSLQSVRTRLMTLAASHTTTHMLHAHRADRSVGNLSMNAPNSVASSMENLVAGYTPATDTMHSQQRPAIHASPCNSSKRTQTAWQQESKSTDQQLQTPVATNQRHVNNTLGMQDDCTTDSPSKPDHQHSVPVLLPSQEARTAAGQHARLNDITPPGWTECDITVFRPCPPSQSNASSPAQQGAVLARNVTATPTTAITPIMPVETPEPELHIRPARALLPALTVTDTLPANKPALPSLPSNSHVLLPALPGSNYKAVNRNDGQYTQPAEAHGSAVEQIVPNQQPPHHNVPSTSFNRQHHIRHSEHNATVVQQYQPVTDTDDVPATRPLSAPVSASQRFDDLTGVAEVKEAKAVGSPIVAPQHFAKKDSDRTNPLPLHNRMVCLPDSTPSHVSRMRAWTAETQHNETDDSQPSQQRHEESKTGSQHQQQQVNASLNDKDAYQHQHGSVLASTELSMIARPPAKHDVAMSALIRTIHAVDKAANSRQSQGTKQLLGQLKTVLTQLAESTDLSHPSSRGTQLKQAGSGLSKQPETTCPVHDSVGAKQQQGMQCAGSVPVAPDADPLQVIRETLQALHRETEQKLASHMAQCKDTQGNQVNSPAHNSCMQQDVCVQPAIVESQTDTAVRLLGQGGTVATTAANHSHTTESARAAVHVVKRSRDEPMDMLAEVEARVRAQLKDLAAVLSQGDTETVGADMPGTVCAGSTLMNEKREEKVPAVILSVVNERKRAAKAMQVSQQKADPTRASQHVPAASYAQDVTSSMKRTQQELLHIDSHIEKRIKAYAFASLAQNDSS